TDLPPPSVSNVYTCLVFGCTVMSQVNGSSASPDLPLKLCRLPVWYWEKKFGSSSETATPVAPPLTVQWMMMSEPGELNGESEVATTGQAGSWVMASVTVTLDPLLPLV